MSFLQKKYSIIRNHFHQKQIYSSLFDQHKASVHALHWNSKKTQEQRFKTFLQAGDLNHKKILDLGCGLGDFFSFLKKRKITAQLYGYDIIDEFLHVAKNRNPDATIEKRNILLNPPQESFDYIFSSGLFAFGNQDFFYHTVQKAFDLVNIAYVFNLHETSEKGFFQIDRKQVIEYIKSLKPQDISIIENQNLSDYTLLMYKKIDH